MKIYTKGIYPNKPRTNAPSFVKGAVSIHVDTLKKWLDENQSLVNEKGYIFLDMLESNKDDSMYFTVNTFKPSDKPVKDTQGESVDDLAKQMEASTGDDYPDEDISPENIPF